MNDVKQQMTDIATFKWNNLWEIYCYDWKRSHLVAGDGSIISFIILAAMCVLIT